MKDLYIKRYEEYTPLLFLQRGYRKKKLIQVNCSPYSYEHNSLIDQFKMDYIFNLDTIMKNEGFSKNTILGKGLIIRRDKLRGIVVYKRTAPKNLSIPELRANIFILLDKVYFNHNLQELARLKKSMNTYGLSSRKQIILLENANFEELFSQDPLKNTFSDYEEEIQKKLSSEFLNSLTVPEVIPEVTEEVSSSNSYMDYHVGDSIVISRRPPMWSSHFTVNNPLTSDIEYPFTTTITQIDYDEGSIEAGDFGRSLDILIEENLISHTNDPLDSVGDINTEEEEWEEEEEFVSDEGQTQSISEHIDEILEREGSVEEVENTTEEVLEINENREEINTN